MKHLKLFFATSKKDPSLVAGVALGWTEPGNFRLLLVGLGWDDERPLRPWPAFTSRPTPKGLTGWCFAWCGLFVNYRREKP